MLTLDLKELVERYELTNRLDDIAAKLYPENKRQRDALARVIRGDAQLDANQIAVLAALLGVDIDSLYSIKGWKSERQKHPKIQIFSSGKFTAELDTRTNITTVFKDGELLYERVIITSATTVSEYIDKLNNLINTSI